MYLSQNSKTPKQLDSFAIIATVLVHAGLLGLLWWGSLWVTQQPTEVELWDVGSLGNSASINNDAPTQDIAPSPTHSTQALESPKVADPNENKPPELSKPDIVTTAKPNQPKQNVAKPQPSTAPKSNASDAVRNDVLAQARSGTNSGRGTGAAAGNGSANYAGYVGKVKSMIESRGNRQGLAGVAGRVSFRVAPNGRVTSVSVTGMPADKAETLKRILYNLELPRQDGVIPQPVLIGGMNFKVRFKSP